MKIKKNKKIIGRNKSTIDHKQNDDEIVLKKNIEYQIFDSRKATFDETSSDYDKLLNDDMCTSLMDEEGNDDYKMKLQNKTIDDEVIDIFH